MYRWKSSKMYNSDLACTTHNSHNTSDNTSSCRTYIWFHVVADYVSKVPTQSNSKLCVASQLAEAFTESVSLTFAYNWVAWKSISFHNPKRFLCLNRTRSVVQAHLQENPMHVKNMTAASFQPQHVLSAGAQWCIIIGMLVFRMTTSLLSLCRAAIQRWAWSWCHKLHSEYVV